MTYIVSLYSVTDLLVYQFSMPTI